MFSALQKMDISTHPGFYNGPEILPKEITSHILRRGKWTVEEERYAEKIICKLCSKLSILKVLKVVFLS
jgi:hypothetical protein